MLYCTERKGPGNYPGPEIHLFGGESYDTASSTACYALSEKEPRWLVGVYRCALILHPFKFCHVGFFVPLTILVSPKDHAGHSVFSFMHEHVPVRGEFLVDFRFSGRHEYVCQDYDEDDANHLMLRPGFAQM